MGVGKPKRSGSGFSAPKPAQASKQQAAKNSADHAAKEQQALALINQGNLQEAEAIYRGLIADRTSNHIVYGNLAAICGMQGRFDELIGLLKKTLQLKSDYPDAHYNLGSALKARGDLVGAIASCNTALQLKPNYPEAHNNLGLALQEQGDLVGAFASYGTALQLKPNYSEAHNNLGLALQEQGDLVGAIASYGTALQLKPNYSEAHWGHSLTMLLSGDYKNGWGKYEWRYKKNAAIKPHSLPSCDRWSGVPALSKISQLLLVAEQGLGDTLQFIRYATALRNLGISGSF
jgi:Flp pilus assembly protein TadD